MDTNSSHTPQTGGALPGGCYALKVRVRGEAGVAQALREKGHQVLYPSFTARRRYSDRIKKVTEALFPGYLFVHLSGDRLQSVVSTDGVNYLLKSGRAPQPLPPAELELIHALCRSELPCEPVEGFKTGQRVRIESGPFAGTEGVLEQVGVPYRGKDGGKDGDADKSKHRVIVSVPSLFRSVSLEIGTDSLHLL